MTTHKTGTRQQWLKERLELLKAEKELTHRSDELALRRRELPWVPINKGYRFETDQGGASLADLFRGRSQLLVYHFMFGPDYSAGCPSCSAIADGFNGIALHLANHDVMLWAVSRAPLSKWQAYKKRLGWTFPCASPTAATSISTSAPPSPKRSSARGLPTTTDAKCHSRSADRRGPRSQARRPMGLGDSRLRAERNVATYIRERPGMSAFALEDGVIYHTYSTYARGLDGLWVMYSWLDRAPKGRNESGLWWRRNDE